MRPTPVFYLALLLVRHPLIFYLVFPSVRPTPCVLFVPILRLLYDKMTTAVLFNGTETEPFTIRTGVKQGCFIAPTLFTVYLYAILFLVHDRLPHDAELEYRLDGRLVNLSHLKAKTKVMKIAIIDLQYADDCAIFAHSTEELQTRLSLFAEAYQSLGLSINFRKTKVIHQPTPGINAGPPEIKVSGGILEVVEHFPYLGIHLSQKATIEAEIQHHICCVSMSFRKGCPSGNYATESLMTTTSGKR